MTVEEATRRLLALLDDNGGSLSAALVEADDQLARNQEIVSAVAHVLATEPDISAGRQTDERSWFPYSFLTRAAR